MRHVKDISLYYHSHLLTSVATYTHKCAQNISLLSSPSITQSCTRYPYEHQQQICPFLYCPLQWLLRELLVQLVENLHLMNCTDFAILVGRGAVAHSLTLPIRLSQAQERAPSP